MDLGPEIWDNVAKIFSGIVILGLGVFCLTQISWERFRWYRRMRGGKWYRTRATRQEAFWGHEMWTRSPLESDQILEEE